MADCGTIYYAVKVNALNAFSIRQAFTTAATACEGAGRSEFGPELSQLGERNVGNTRYNVLQNKENKDLDLSESS